MNHDLEITIRLSLPSLRLCIHGCLCVPREEEEQRLRRHLLLLLLVLSARCRETACDVRSKRSRNEGESEEERTSDCIKCKTTARLCRLTGDVNESFISAPRVFVSACVYVGSVRIVYCVCALCRTTLQNGKGMERGGIRGRE